MNRTRAIVIAIVGLAAAAGSASAQAPAPQSATTPAPAASAPAPSKPSATTRVETWTKKQWNAAQQEWAKDKMKWADCQQRSQAQKLSGRKSWSFLYQCMKS